MAVRPISHFTWQVLRTLKRSSSPLTGRDLRLVPTRRTKDGSFLTELVAEGLLRRVTGAAATPFDSTYDLTSLGDHAAEYGEYDHNLRPAIQDVPQTKPKTPRRSK